MLGAAAVPVMLAVAAMGIASQVVAEPRTLTKPPRLTVEVAVVGLLQPGVSRPLALTITNSSGQRVRLTSLSVVVETATPTPEQPDLACDGRSNFAISQSVDLTRMEVTLPARATRSLADLGIPEGEWPKVAMRDLGTDQDPCQGAQLTVTVSAAGERVPAS